MSVLRLFLVFTVVAVFAGCLQTSSEATFLGGRDEDLCEGVYLVCKGHAAGCKLDNNHFLAGTFPGQRKFLVETTRGDWKIKVLLFLKERISPGTETLVSWFEPGCTDEYIYKLSKNQEKGDLFEQAGRDQTFEVEKPVIEAGDHLITIWSDAVARYDLRIEINKR